MPTTLQDIEIREGLVGITPARIATLYRRAPLLRPTDNPSQLQKMFDSATLVVSAWQGERLVGIARVVSDGVLFSLLCDLAVEPDVQGAGIGKRLTDAVLERCEGTELILRDSNLSTGFYERLGFAPVRNAWSKQA